MPKKILPLTIAQVKAAQPREKMYRLADGQGLALWIYPTGLKSWRLAYTRPDGGKDTLTLGSIDKYTLAQARRWRDENREKIANGENPKEPKKNKLFKAIFELWFEKWSPTVTPRHAGQVERMIKANAIRYLGHLEIDKIEPMHIIDALTPMEARGKIGYLQKCKTTLNLIFNFAIIRGLIKYNPVSTINNKAFKPHISKHLDALQPNQLPDLVDFLENGKLEPATRLCIYLQLLTMTRPSEAAGARWEEIDIENKIWVIPAARMKARREHVVLLSKFAIKILTEAQKISAGREFVFIGRDFDKHINVSSARNALRAGGINTTAHGLRSLASTTLNESGLFRPDVIETALAHQSHDQVRAAYNRAEYMRERAKMLEWWAKKISNLIKTADVK